MDRDRIAPTTTDSTAREKREERFTFGLVFDVLKVLQDHGYELVAGPQTVDLMLHLLHFLHGEGDSCMGGTHDRQVRDDVAEHRAETDRKIQALRASEASTEAALTRSDEHEARRHGGR
jgi:hypothetical protein